jgi:hypothetical protein
LTYSAQESEYDMGGRRTSIIIAGTGVYYGMTIFTVSTSMWQKIESTLQQFANVMVLTARQDGWIISIERRVYRPEGAPQRHLSPASLFKSRPGCSVQLHMTKPQQVCHHAD